MKQRYRLYRRSCSGRFYIHDNVTGKQESLGTADRIEALRLLHSKNEADRQPAINLQIARAYLAAGDPDIMTRTWQVVMDELVRTKLGSTRERYVRSFKEHALDSLRSLPILQTRPEHYLHALEVGTVSTNDILRRVHNFALAMTWLPWPILTKKQWPALHYGEKRGITWEEHQAIVAAEKNPERKTFHFVEPGGALLASVSAPRVYGHQSAFLSLCVGRASQDGGLSRTLRAGSAGAQEQRNAGRGAFSVRKISIRCCGCTNSGIRTQLT